jgi:putative sterol carrier protein
MPDEQLIQRIEESLEGDQEQLEEDLPDILADLEGQTDELVGLIIGDVDPIQGFMQQQYHMDGPVQKGTKLAPIMNSLTNEVPQ